MAAVIHFVTQSFLMHRPTIEHHQNSPMKIIRARHMGMCFGVKDAIDLAMETGEHTPLTILGELVHNDTVNAELKNRGVRVERDLENVRTKLAMITAHGASEKMKQSARDRGLLILEATCPLVRAAHRSVMRLAEEGYHPVIIGRHGHVEVRGLTEDLKEFDVVQDERDVARLAPRSRFGVIAQTTQPLDRVGYLVEAIRARHPHAEIRFVDTVCHPTKQRQAAAIELAKKVELVLVIGGAQSNNTAELCATCRKHCPRVYHVQTAIDLRSEWFEGIKSVGITAGTSTPQSTIDDIEKWVLAWVDEHAQPQPTTESRCVAA